MAAIQQSLQQQLAQSPTLQPGWPLLHLPATAQQAVVACLSKADRRTLRLACSDTASLVDECVTQLQISCKALATFTSPLARRFASATALYLGNDDRRNLTNLDINEVYQGVAACMAVRLPTISSLMLEGLPPDAVDDTISACPNAEQCSIGCVWMGEGHELLVVDTVQHISTALTRLRALKLSCAYILRDAELAALAACHSLTSLTAYLGQLSSSGWGTLLGMTGLMSLQISTRRFGGSWYHLPPGVQLDLRPLSNLQRLTLGDTNKWGAGPSQDWALVQHIYSHLIPPPSASYMELQRMFAHSAAAPHLIELHITEQQLTDEDLCSLAAACPVLAKMCLRQLRISSVSHDAPLQALTQLQVLSGFSAVTAVRLAIAFPSLRSLIISGNCAVADTDVLLGGAQSLQRLDLTCTHDACPLSRLLPMSARMRFDMSTRPLPMSARMLFDLSTMQCLTSLHLYAKWAHIEFLSRFIFLREVAWVCNLAFDSVTNLVNAFTHFKAPPSLVMATFWFQGYHAHSDEEDDMVHPVSRVADAAIDWCIRAPALHTVSWELIGTAAGACAAMSTVRLCALSASDSIKQITIDASGNSPVASPQSLLDMAHMLATNRGLKVSIRPNAAQV